MNVGLFEEIPLHIYPFPIWFSMAQTDDEFIQSLLENDLLVTKDFIEDVRYFAKVWTSSRGDIIFRVAKYPEKYYDIGAISHDALHTVISALDMAGLRLSNDSEEAYTYLLGYVVAKITELYTNKLFELGL